MGASIRFRRRSTWALAVLGSVALAACRKAEKPDVEVEVRQVGMDAAAHAPVVILEDHAGKMALPIWIGPSEAEAIAMQMQGINPPRPMTHDLIKTIIERTGVEFQKVVIRSLKESTYYADIYLHTGRDDVEIDSRPSDAIALAVRFHRPIFIAASLLTAGNAVDLQREVRGDTANQLSGLTVQALTDELAEYFNLPPGKGVLIANVAADAPPGLQRGDIILEIDGAAVASVGDFAARIAAAEPGVPAELSVQRGTERIAVQFAARGAR